MTNQLSNTTSNAVIYTTYVAFFVFGLFASWKWARSKADFIASLRTQSTIPVALNFTAASLGASVFYTYPQLGTVAGIAGITIYAVASSVPILSFAYFPPIVRESLPEAELFTQWVQWRYGTAVHVWVSALTLVTLFVFAIAELASISQVITALTGLDGLPALILECLFTSIYTAYGGLRTSIITDNVQGAMIVMLMVLCTIAIGTTVKIDRSTIHSSGLVQPTQLSWQLLFIFFVAIFFNLLIIAALWQRAFASKDDRSLRRGVGIAAIAIFLLIYLLGWAGVIAAWANVWPGNPPQPGAVAFFLILDTLPSWIVAFVIIFAVSLSMAAYDSLQVAMVMTVAHDIFRNKLPLRYVRVLVLLINAPIIALAIRNVNIVVVYLVAQLISVAAMPPLLLGMFKPFNFIQGPDVLLGGIGGYFSVFIFGTIYFGTAREGIKLLVLPEGLQAGDWSTFGAFAVAPIVALIICFLFSFLRSLFAKCLNQARIYLGAQSNSSSEQSQRS
ncbi:uncharacterized protein K441DRAFT_599705 [Cenococcum geophilum 1.58]|uniref:uncharacterized protein n=1 Tax=Cenococcum geophilum 1.58 TaxID=794803 RepID=UPI00358E2279|nr:hypothetical protein K441DRAFT_599705 [Cenococcum geophilum 1.58]